MSILFIEHTTKDDNLTRPFATVLSSGKKIPTCFLTVKDISELTGMSIPTVRAMFNSKDFPASRWGRSAIVELNSFVRYFSVKRSRR